MNFNPSIIKKPSNGFIATVINLLSLYADPSVFEKKIKDELRYKKDFIKRDGFNEYQKLLKKECPACGARVHQEQDFFFFENRLYYCGSCEEEFDLNEIESTYFELTNQCTDITFRADDVSF